MKEWVWRKRGCEWGKKNKKHRVERKGVCKKDENGNAGIMDHRMRERDIREGDWMKRGRKKYAVAGNNLLRCFSHVRINRALGGNRTLIV